MASHYRLSNEKHWCEHCRCWTQRDALSIKHHESGSRHKEALRTFLIDARKRKVAERRAADETQATLAAMSEAAEAAVAEDFRREAVAFPPPPPLPPGPPPLGAQGLHFVPRASAAVFRPPALQQQGRGGSDSAGGWDDAHRGAEAAAEEEDLGDGTYEAAGRHYLMGEHPSAARLLLPGTVCEALWAVDGRWRTAVIVGPGREVAVPNTTVRARLYTIEHCGQEGGVGADAAGAAAAHASRFVTELTASSLRLPLSQAQLDALRGAGAGAGAAGAPAAEPQAGALAAAAGAPAAEPPPLDSATGLGVWQAVPVEEEQGRGRGRKRGRGAEEEEEEEGEAHATSARHRAHAALASDTQSDPSKALDALANASRGVGAAAAAPLRGLDTGADVDGGQDDALAAFNPFGSSLYRGFKIGGEGTAAAATAGTGIKAETQAVAAAPGAQAFSSLLPPTVPVQLAAEAVPAPAAGSAGIEFKARAKAGRGRVRGQDD